jgi:hypothetical protein
MKYQRRIVPPTLGPPQAPTRSKLEELDRMWTGIVPRPRSSVRTAFPPARSDDEILAIVDEFTHELCGGFY